jgi:transcription antitermination protein NusB
MANSKTLSREYAFKFLYHLQLPEFQKLRETLSDGGQGNKDNKELLNQLLEEFDHSYQEEDFEHPDNISTFQIRHFAREMINGVIRHCEELEQKVEKYLTNWRFKNIDKIDQTILFLASYELTYARQTPAKVVINEAVNLARKFGPVDSFAFINGILDNMAKNTGQLAENKS